jgi:hypothetical protein
MPRVRRPPRRRHALLAAIIAVPLLGAAALWSNAFGVSDSLGEVARRIELIVDPPPDRPIEATVHVTPRPVPPPEPTPEPPASLAPGATEAPTPTPKPKPARVKVDVNLLTDPDKHFITEIDHEWCAVAGTQMVLALHGKGDLTEAFQRKLQSRIDEWESRRDSLNGGWGPAATVAALKAYGVPGYQVRAYDTRADALYDAAVALSTTHAPVLLFTWRGAHTWVMTGYRATADPTIFADAKVSGTYVLDPWYPRISSIWGPSDPPGTFQDRSEMDRNYLPWKRPEGHYADRDGLFIAVVPTVSLDR